jgi:hypothetical protein
LLVCDCSSSNTLGFLDLCAAVLAPGLGWHPRGSEAS